MKKIVILMWIVLASISCRAQTLTDNYAAFEHLVADVTSVVDSCLSCSDEDSMLYYSTNFMMVVCLDSNGYICRAKLIDKNTPSKENQITCIEQSLLSCSNQYDIFIEDYHYLKDRYWKLHEYAMYTIPYRGRKKVESRNHAG